MTIASTSASYSPGLGLGVMAEAVDSGFNEIFHYWVLYFFVVNDIAFSCFCKCLFCSSELIQHKQGNANADAMSWRLQKDSQFI